MNPLQEKPIDLVNSIRQSIEAAAFDAFNKNESVQAAKDAAFCKELQSIINLTLEEAKKIVAESPDDLSGAYEALNKMKL